MVNKIINKREMDDRISIKREQQRRQMRIHRINNEIRELRKSYSIEYDMFNSNIDEIIINKPIANAKQPLYRCIVCFPEYYPWKPFQCNIEIDIPKLLKQYKIPLWEVLSQSLTYDVVETIIKRMVETTPPVRTSLCSVLNCCDTDHFVDVYTEAYHDCWTPVMCAKPMLEVFTKKLII